jgi:hypothetical protein
MKALSVRQPWAWAIIYAGKNVENRSAAALRRMDIHKGHIYQIHASKGMTQDEYDEAADFIWSTFRIDIPGAKFLKRGGVIGSVRFDGIVMMAISPWFFGPLAIVLSDPKPCEFVPGPGSLGLFDFTPQEGYEPPPMRWMLKAAAPVQAPDEPGLL